MTNERIPNDPHRSGPGDGNLNRAARLDNEVQPDPVLREGRVSSGWATIVAVGIAVVLGVVFYALNNSGMHEASTAPPTQTAQSSTPHANTAPNPNASPGVTTGAAPTRPTPPATTPKPNPQAGDNPTGQTNPSR